MSSFDDDPYDADPFASPQEKLEPVNVGPLTKTPPEKTETAGPIPHRRKNGPSQGDVVLLSYLDPNRPDLWEQGRKALRVSLSPTDRPPKESTSDGNDPAIPINSVEETEEDLDERLSREMIEKEKKRMAEERTQKERAAAASKALNLHITQTPQSTPTPPLQDREMRDGPPILSPPQHYHQPVQPAPSNQNAPTGLRISVGNTNVPAPHTSVPTMNPPMRRKYSEPANIRSITNGSSFNNKPDSPSGLDQPFIKTLLREPPSENHRLPALRSDLPGTDPTSPEATGLTSPKSETLPGVGPLLDIAKEGNRRPRHDSIGSAAAPSPRNYIAPSPSSLLSSYSLISAMSPASYREYTTRHPPSTATSPSYHILNYPRRMSQASDMYPQHSASTASDSYATSPDTTTTLSPDAQTGTAITTPSERSVHMGERPRGSSMTGPPPPIAPSLPGIPPGPLSANGIIPGSGGRYLHDVTLPPIGPLVGPPPSQPPIHTVPAHGSSGYVCDHPGCNAAPFQTQYLLNSHTTVHSNQRPHYCPIPTCHRSRQGQGFKRKNEMIRHQLVHDSPGYVCPFCPEREHKYPRPDNLQRHVRVHHSDIPSTDRRLREVLEKKASGRGTARRRRGAS